MDQPYDRVNQGLRERPLSSDFNRASSQMDRTIRETLCALLTPRTSISSVGATPASGFIGAGFRVVPTNPIGMTVQVSAGLGFIYQPLDLPTDIGATDLESVDDLSAYKPVWLAAPSSFVVPAAPGVGQERIDIIEVKVDRRLDDSVTRRQLDTATAAMVDHSFYKTLTFALDGRTGSVNSPSSSTAGISYKVGAGAAAGAAVEPSVTSGYVQIARINVAASVVSVDTNALVDRRPLLGPGGRVAFSGQWRVQWNAGTPIVTTIACDAPPGLQVGLQGLGVRGKAIAYVAGGEITHGVAMMTASHANGLLFTDRVAFGVPSYVLAPVTTVDSTIQTAMAASTPSLGIGIGAKVLRAQIESRFITNTGTSNNTDTSLEDAIITLVGSVSCGS